MSLPEMHFRSAVAGFHRGEVLDYIRALSHSHEEELSALRQALSVALPPEQATEQAAQLAALAEEGKRLREENERLRAENIRLQEQLKAWEPGISSYDTLRLQLGEIELDARARSAALLSRARAQEQALYERAEGNLRRAEQCLRQELGSADATLAQLSGELERLNCALQGLGGSLARELSALSALHVRPEEAQEHE